MDPGDLKQWKKATVSETSASPHPLQRTAPGRRMEDSPKSYASLKPPSLCPGYLSSHSRGFSSALNTRQCLPASARATAAFPKHCSLAGTHGSIATCTETC